MSQLNSVAQDGIRDGWLRGVEVIAAALEAGGSSAGRRISSPVSRRSPTGATWIAESSPAPTQTSRCLSEISHQFYLRRGGSVWDGVTLRFRQRLLFSLTNGPFSWLEAWLIESGVAFSGH